MAKAKIQRAPKFSPRTYLLIIVVALVIGYGLFKAFAASNPLSSYYPNTNRYQSAYYLEGLNYEGPNAPARSVLWFKSFANGMFHQYNYAPYTTCHWDQLQWTGGYLKYKETNDQCSPNNNQVILDAPIVFMPANWSDGNAWSYSGNSSETHYDHGKVVCTGTNKWKSKI